MKKVVLIIISAIMLFAFSNKSKAVDNYQMFEESVSDELFSSIDSDVMEILKDMGISEGSLSDVSNFSLKNITRFFSDTLKEKIKKCLKDILLLLSVILVVGSVSSLFLGENNEGMVSMLSCIVTVLLMVNIIEDSLSAAMSVLRLSGKFMLSFVPVYTMIISFAGNTASALTYNSLVMAFSELLSSFISYFSADLLGVYFCLAISFSINERMNVNRFISAVNKSTSVVLGLISGLFTGFLSVKGILSASLDGVSVKGIKFLISSLIPVVGSAISDAYSSLIGSINLIKSSAAFIAILVILIINLPIILENLIYYISLSLLSNVSDMIGSKKLGETLRCFSCGVRILLLLCVFEMFILIISTGVMLTLKGTV